MNLGSMIRKLRDPRFLMLLMMGGKAISEMAQKALSDGKLTVGETVGIVKEISEVTGFSEVVIWQKEGERSS